MLALTKRTEYALIALHHMMTEGAISEIGTNGKLNPVSAREIAERFSVPLPLLMNILKKLASEKVLISVRGAKGGYVMATDPRQMSLSKLIDAVEGPVAMIECACEDRSESELDPLVPESYRCKLAQTCPIKRPLQMLHDRLMDFLKTTSVYDVCSYRDEVPLTQVGVTLPA